MREARRPGRLLGCLYSKPKRCRAVGKSNVVAAWADDAKEDHGGGEVSEAGQNDRADPAGELPVVPGGVYHPRGPFEAGEG